MRQLQIHSRQKQAREFSRRSIPAIKTKINSPPCLEFFCPNIDFNCVMFHFQRAMFGFVVSDQVFQIRFWLAPFMTCETSERRKAGSGLRRENWLFSKSINTNTLNSSKAVILWNFEVRYDLFLGLFSELLSRSAAPENKKCQPAMQSLHNKSFSAL